MDLQDELRAAVVALSMELIFWQRLRLRFRLTLGLVFWRRKLHRQVEASLKELPAPE